MVYGIDKVFKKMKLTQEQEDIIRSNGDIIINAVAGSGKTSTLIEYARSRPTSCRILYLAFNRSVKLEAIQRFAKEGLSNVKVETAHSLAFKEVIVAKNYSLKVHGYTTSEIAEILKIRVSGDKHVEFVIANHINKFFTFFCNSDKSRLEDLNYLDTISEPKAKSFVASFYSYIASKTIVFLKKMENAEIEISHDFYLKKFQLSAPNLPFDYILFDEGQDASPAMLDIFMKQKATKVIVGDTHQQIYSWRFAVNSLEKTDFTTFLLSTSFRFSQDIANLAREVLSLKAHIKKHEAVSISGKGNHDSVRIKATLARTNLGLLQKAIEYISDNQQAKSIYFEGNFNSYTYADEGASLYDVLHLYNGKNKLIKDKLIRTMKDISELEDFAEKTEDIQLSIMVDIIKKYGNRIPGIIRSIKDKHIGNEERKEAEMIFSTVHRCKGMEYDSVLLAGDFMTEERLLKIINSSSSQEFNATKLNEEINLLYVAITRARNTIYIPEKLMPKDFPPSAYIHLIKSATDQTKQSDYKFASPVNKAEMDNTVTKAYSVNEIRSRYVQAYRPWTIDLDEELAEMYFGGALMDDLVLHFGRTKGAIKCRIGKLDLENSLN